MRVQIPSWEGAILREDRAARCKVQTHSAVSCAKRLYRSRCCLGFELGWVRAPCIRHNLANTIEPSMCDGDEAFCQITSTTCCYITREARRGEAECILVTRVCVSVCVCVCLSVCMSVAVFPHYCMDPDVTWRNGSGCPLFVHYWADLQSVHGFRCYDNVDRTRSVSECLYSLYAWLLLLYCPARDT